jgi:DNA (cytosine-5)-methyltransferase 1
VWEVKVRAVFDNAGAVRGLDFTDRPCPAITHGTGGNYWHYQLEVYQTEEPPAMTTPPADKPPYRVPSMAEIAAVPWNGYRAISTFSGCGGSSLGYKMAGFRVLWANEFIPAAQDTYRANHPTTILDTRDIRKIHPREILQAIGLRAGELDLLDGSPPCASFSTSGNREKGWGKVKPYSDTKQRTDDLFFEFTRLLRALQPKVFVAENVSGLVKGTAVGMFKEIIRDLKGCGYQVDAQLLDAQWLGVPQMRQRIIFVGVRNDLAQRYGVGPAFPRPLPYRYSVRDALPWVVKVGHAGNVNHPALKWKGSELPSPTIVQSGAELTEGAYLSGGAWIEAMRDPENGASLELPPSRLRDPEDTAYIVKQVDPEEPSPTITAGGAPGTQGNTHVVPVNPFPVEPESDISRYAIGPEWDKLEPGGQSKKYLSLHRAPIDGPSPTVTALGNAYVSGAAASVAHPTEKRKFSIGELRRICGFPDDFVLTGSYAQQWERLGRAVPPVMMAAIARTVAEEILDRIRAAEAAEEER